MNSPEWEKNDIQSIIYCATASNKTPTDLQSRVNPFANLHIKRGLWNGNGLLKDALCCQENSWRRILYPDCHLVAIDLGEVGVCIWGLHTFIKHYLFFNRLHFIFLIYTYFFYSFSAAKEITAALNLHNTRFGWKKCESENVQVYTLECAGNSAQGHTKQYKLWNFLKSVCKVDAGCQRIRYLFFVEVCRCQQIEILIRIKCDEGDLYEVSEMVIFWKRWKVVDGKWILLCFHFHVTTRTQSFCMDYLISVF